MRKYRTIFEDVDQEQVRSNVAQDDTNVSNSDLRVAAKTVKDAIGDDYQKFIMKLTGLEGLPSEKMVANVDTKVKTILNLGLKDLNVDGEKLSINYEANIEVTKLLPTQSEIGLIDSIGWLLFVQPELAANPLRGQAIFLNDAGNEEYILTANGTYVLDGHHRWSQTYIMNPAAKVKCVDITFPTKNPAEMLKAIQMAIAAAYGGLYMKPASTETDIFRIPEGESSLKLLREIISGKYGCDEGNGGKLENVNEFIKVVAKELGDKLNSQSQNSGEAQKNNDKNELKVKVEKYLAKNADKLRKENGKQSNIPRVIMPQPANTRDKVKGPKEDIKGIPTKVLKSLEIGKVNFSDKDGILPKESQVSQVSQDQKGRKHVQTYEQFRKFYK